MSKAVQNTSNFNINRFSPIFQRYLIKRLEDKDWSGRYLASIVGCNEGQISHIRRLGHNPGPEPLPPYTLVDFVDDWGRMWLICWPILITALLLDWWRA